MPIRSLFAFSLLAAALATLLTACGGGASPPTPDPDSPVLVIASSDLAVGSNRLVFALFTQDRRPITDAGVNLRFFSDDKGALQERAQAGGVFRGRTTYGEGVELIRSLYTAIVSFDKAGVWQAEARLTRPGRGAEVAKASFQVQRDSKTPGIGALAPASRNQSLADGSGLKDLTSDSAPDPDLYRLSINDTIRQDKPFLVTFSTPAFCTTRTCGPQLDVVKDLKAAYKDRMNFLHVEVYADPAGLLAGGSNRAIRPAVAEWQLPTEPWVFLVDGDGRVFAKFEGFTTKEELEEAVKALLAKG